MENVAIASEMSDARPGLMLDIVEMGDVPLVEVNILVLSGLMKQPRDRPRSLNCWQRKSRSSRGTTDVIDDNYRRGCCTFGRWCH